MRPFGFQVPETPRTQGDRTDWRASVCTFPPTPIPQHDSWHLRAPPRPGMPARIPACVVSPGPLSHVRWQSVPSCLHSSAVKTATLGPGLVDTPECGSERAGRELQGHMCAYVCLAVPCVHMCMDLCVCRYAQGGMHTCVDMHKSMKGARGLLCRRELMNP